jgi:uncharacterized protein (DUF1501 family)
LLFDFDVRLLQRLALKHVQIANQHKEETPVMLIRSRREFLKDTLRSVTALGAAGSMAKFGEMNALAAGSSNYQALVCIFLLGGNDGHNTVIPITTAQQNYSLYQQNRGGLAIAQNTLLPIANGGDTYGLHPSLVEMQGLYNQGNAAVLANVGMMVQPMTRSAYLNNHNSALVPSALFSHSDQSAQWQTGIPAGNGSSGWGGRITDLVQPQNSAAIFPAVTATTGCELFCTGATTSPAAVPPPYNGSPLPTGMATLASLGPNTASGLQQLLQFSNGVQLVQSANTIMTNGNNYANTLTKMLAAATPLKTAFPANNPLAAQLHTVANVLSVRGPLGLNRQIFFCALDGFDTHSAQVETQTPLLQQLSQAVLAFYQATQEMGIDSAVTTFTASEFGRTLTPSGSDGSDHAWGNHHFIIGSNVAGGKFYGNFPLLAPGGPNDAGTRGVLLPTTAVDQYGATLAQWFGVAASSLPTAFPNIANFGSNNLGFLA